MKTVQIEIAEGFGPAIATAATPPRRLLAAGHHRLAPRQIDANITIALLGNARRVLRIVEEQSGCIIAASWGIAPPTHATLSPSLGLATG
ncbi:MAG: hypothetical protein IPM61_10005 [Chlorobi bacterium]|nr:hypothetical protein [Chlorobiota bacterium]MBX7216606.1 hypothetical protein [Candidatus Kapabacteria bacterium]